jgi:hypothetical protein
MKCIKQFRYYGKNSNQNEPSNMQFTNLAHGNIFSGYGSITQMGIQAPRGTVMYLNNEQRYPIVIGDTGIYEIDLQDYGQIYAIRFEGASLEALDRQGSTGRLLIDIIYEGAGADV